MQLGGCLYRLLFAAFILSAPLWAGPAPAAAGDDAMPAGDLTADFNAYLFCNPARSEVLSCERLLMVYPVLPRLEAGSDGWEPDSRSPSDSLPWEETRGRGIVRRRSLGPLFKYDAGLMKNMFDGNVLGWGFQYNLSPSMSLSGQTGLGFADEGAQGMMSYGIKITF
jgi:hypothetical protein